MTLLVFGSINMDLVARTPRLPAPAETIIGHQFFTAPGGKGANQAVATARLGQPTQMIGRVGGDGFGQDLLQNLALVGVDTSAIFVDSQTSSGVAIIAVDDQAQNNIIVIPAANGRVGQPDVDRVKSCLTNAKILLLQLEVPLDAIVAAAQAAQEQGVTVILDPAPAVDNLPEQLFKAIDIITPNEVEASQLVGFAVQTKDDAQQAANALLAKGTKTAIIKMGAVGVYYASADEQGFVDAFKVDAIDTVAAGDAFNGGLATALTEGHTLPEAVRWGAATGALSTTKTGAQQSMPSRADVETFLEVQ